MSSAQVSCTALIQHEWECRSDFDAAIEKWRMQQFAYFRRELGWLLELASAEVQFYEVRCRQQLEDDAAAERRALLLRHAPVLVSAMQSPVSVAALLLARASRMSEHLLDVHALHSAAVAHRRSIEAYEYLMRHVAAEMHHENLVRVMGSRTGAPATWIADVRRCIDSATSVARLLQCSDSQRRGAIARLRAFVDTCATEAPLQLESSRQPVSRLALAAATAARNRVHDEAMSCIRRLHWEEEAARLRLVQAHQLRTSWRR